MKHIKIFEEENSEKPKNNPAQILSEMIQVSNNSRLTNIVAIALADKLDAKEIRDFKEWLKLITPTSQVMNLKSKIKRGY
jgi:hypothetical protein